MTILTADSQSAWYCKNLVKQFKQFRIDFILDVFMGVCVCERARVSVHVCVHCACVLWLSLF